MQLNELKKSKGLNKASIRRGRGNSSGRGNYSGRGMKGQGQRSGGSMPAWFEGGQTPLNLRLPKLRGFKRPEKLRTIYNVINIQDLQADDRIKDKATLDKKTFKDLGYIKKQDALIKILGTGDIKKALKFQGIEAFSATAAQKIEKAGGSTGIQKDVEQAKEVKEEKKAEDK